LRTTWGIPKNPREIWNDLVGEELIKQMWLGALYGINPQGSKALGGTAALAAVLQKLAWDTLIKESLNRLTVKPG